MLLHILLVTVKLILVVCDEAEIVPTNHRHPQHPPTFYQQHSRYPARQPQNDAKTFRLIRQMLKNNYKDNAKQKHRLFPSERNSRPFPRRPVILLNKNKNLDTNPQRFTRVGKRPRKILNWPSKTVNDSHARKEIQNNQVHFKENARKVKLDNNLKVSLNNTKAVIGKVSSAPKKTGANNSQPTKEVIDRTFIYSALTKGKTSSVSPKFIIKEAGMKTKIHANV